MAITGTGTVDDPYLLYSYTDLRNVCGDGTRTGGTNVWCKLMVDINCNEACPTGWSAVKMNMNFDLNRHKIIAPLCKDGVSLFYCDKTSIYGTFIIKNGEILNIFEEYTGIFVGYSGMYPFFRGCYIQNTNGTCGGRCEFRIENMGFSIFVRNRPCIVNSQQGYGVSGSCYNSTIKLSGDLRNYVQGSSVSGTIFSIGTFQNCRFILNKLKTNIYNALWLQNHNNDTGRTPPVSSCRVDGETIGALNLGGGNIQGEGSKIDCGFLKDMFVAVKEGKEAGWNDGINKYYSNGVSIFVDLNGGHSSFAPASDNNFKGVTDAVAKDVEDLNDTGFVTIEVS